MVVKRVKGWGGKVRLLMNDIRGLYMRVPIHARSITAAARQWSRGTPAEFGLEGCFPYDEALEQLKSALLFDNGRCYVTADDLTVIFTL